MRGEEEEKNWENTTSREYEERLEEKEIQQSTKRERERERMLHLNKQRA